MFYLDGKYYKAEWVKDSFTRTGEIINGDNSKRLQGNKDMYLEFVGTFFNFKGELRRGKDCSDKEWEDLFLALSNPINKHTVRVPFGQGQMETVIYVSNTQNLLKSIKNGVKRWDNVLTVNFVALKSQWLANGKLKGVSP